MDREDRNLIGSMILVMAVYNVIATIPILIFSQNKLTNELGLVAGFAMAVGMLLHMHSVTVRSFYYEGNKKALFIRNSIARYLTVAAILAVGGLTGWANPLFMLVGMLGLKVSAYLQKPVWFEEKK